MSSCSGNWRARWAIILTLVWVVWLGASSMIWEVASTSPDLGPTWDPDKYPAYAASVLYAHNRGLSLSPEATRAWPVRVEDVDLMSRLLGVSDEGWSYLYIPESPRKEYVPSLQNGEFAPLAFVVGAFGFAVFGPESSATRAVSNLLLMAFVVFMAWHGWQLAGFRGALLLGLASAASPWVFQWLRFYNYQSGALLMLAMAMVAAQASQGLTRPLACAWLGAFLGVAILFIQLALFATMPWLIALALPDLLKSRYTLVGASLLLLLCQIVWLRYSWGVQPGASSPDWLNPFVTAGVLLVLLLLLATAWLQARKHGWRPVTGLAVAVATAGLVSAPFFLLVQGAQMQIARENLAVRPGIAALLWQPAQILHSFHWLGLVWMLVGVVVLARWHRFGLLGFRLAFSLFAGSLMMALMVPVNLKYLVVFLPLALVLGFIWAARWRASFVAVMLILLGSLWVQSFGWLDLEDKRVTWLPVPLVSPDSLSGEIEEGKPWWYYFPVAEFPTGNLRFWDQFPRGLRTSLLFYNRELPGEHGPHQWRQGSMDCLAMNLSLRGQLLKPTLLKEGDHVLIASSFPYKPPNDLQVGGFRLSAPDHFYHSEAWFRYPLLLQLRRVQSVP